MFELKLIKLVSSYIFMFYKKKKNRWKGALRNTLYNHDGNRDSKTVLMKFQNILRNARNTPIKFNKGSNTFVSVLAQLQLVEAIFARTRDFWLVERIC